MKKYLLVAFITTLVVTTFSFNSFGGTGNSSVRVFAQGASVSGDEVCGATKDRKCTLADAKNITKNLIINIVVPIGSALLVCFIVFRLLMAQKALMEGNAMAYKEAGKKIANAVFGFMIVIAVVGGLLLAMLKFLTVGPEFLKLLSEAFIPHAYAQTLPNPLGVNSLYDFILLLVRLFIRWFVYPAIVAVWVWTGFAFVAAQGRPEELVKAKKWLLWAFICTCLIFVTEGFLFALRGTVNQIIPTGAASATYQPAPGTTGAVCSMPGGGQGMTDATGACVSTARGATTAALPTSCAGLSAGTMCSVAGGSGTCGSNGNVYGCYRAAVGDSCILNGSAGTIGNNFQCEPPTARPLVGAGGSCRIGQECQSNTCTAGVCQ